MITDNNLTNQLPKAIQSIFNELNILHYLRQAGITKAKGYSVGFIFTYIFSLVFEGKSLFRLLQSRKGQDGPRKDAIYRFYDDPKKNWRRFLLSLSASVISKISSLTRHDRPKVLVLDDSAYKRDRSKKVELLARCFDHSGTTPGFYKGFRMLTLGWTDGATFMPVDFSLLSSSKKNNRLSDAKEGIDKRTSGYKRRAEAVKKAPAVIPDMVKRALSSGIQASYILMDSWFTQQPLIKDLTDMGIDVIGMVKKTNQRYLVGDRYVSLKDLYTLAAPKGGSSSILRSIHTEMANGIKVKIVFVRNRNKKRDWLAVLSTDRTLSDKEIIRIYGMRWDIEVFFKTTKSLLKLQSEHQSRSYDSLIAHTTIVFVRYIVLSWQNRCSSDERTLGGMFYELCDEVNELDWAVALQTLISLLDEISQKVTEKLKRFIDCQVQQWAACLPCYIKGYLPQLNCES